MLIDEMFAFKVVRYCYKRKKITTVVRFKDKS